MATPPMRRVRWLGVALALVALAGGTPTGLGGCTPAGEPRVRDPQAAEPLGPLPGRVGYRHAYVFEEDWFTHHTPHWAALLEPYRGKPDVHYLEVGVWEGRSFFWMLDNVLTHPTSSATGIDIFVHEHLVENLERSGAGDRAEILQGYSQVELRKLPAETYDVIYIDGSHTADDVLEDMVLAWPLLEPGGLMILDDYGWDGAENAGGRPMPEDLLPRIAIDAFLSTYRNFVEVVHKDYQVALRRLPVACPRGPWQCSRLGRYGYDWNQRTLYEDGEPVELSDDERELVETLIESRTGDGLTLAIDPRVLRSRELALLDERLGLDLR